ncbi:hypothetical protein ACFFTN_07855 [Aminobacter aganoensis]|uniref:Uncharacterized protein n=1 Tax=Aminobacter aganoensis TaxID=83264 RepID=A0A7X0F9L2_9HYPH|nr:MULTISPECIES: hypothetical protein [Aminobacter]KQU73152.1 hypothetical protein ASC75_05735 [Aminobacter sp. DSM 101952]MBB6355610.1 hypothetical protein [Aminobacter aganoensis]
MSTDVLKATFVQPARLQPVFDWFRQMRAALNVPVQDASELSEHYRRDTGIAKQDIAKAVDADLGRLGLLDIGWQQPRRQSHR